MKGVEIVGVGLQHPLLAVGVAPFSLLDGTVCGHILQHAVGHLVANDKETIALRFQTPELLGAVIDLVPAQTCLQPGGYHFAIGALRHPEPVVGGVVGVGSVGSAQLGGFILQLFYQRILAGPGLAVQFLDSNRGLDLAVFQQM